MRAEEGFRKKKTTLVLFHMILVDREIFAPTNLGTGIAKKMGLSPFLFFLIAVLFLFEPVGND